MKTIILDIQKDQFESSVLEQSADIGFVSFDDALSMKDASCVLLGSKGIDDFTGMVRKLAHAHYKKGGGLIIVNPPIDNDIGSVIDAPVSIAVNRRKASSICSPSGFESLSAGRKYEIWSDGTISSSLSSGIMGVDDNKEIILLKYQPKNTSGAVFITTLKLLSYSGMTNEADRECLLKLLLNWENKQSLTTVDSIEEPDTIDESVLHTVAILSFAYNSVAPDKIHTAMSRFFTLDCDVKTIQLAIESLALKLETTNENLISKLGNFIDQAGHYSYAREIKEMLEDEEADS